MESEISVLQVEKRIRTRVKRQMEKRQREYYLNEQMKAIQKELGDEERKELSLPSLKTRSRRRSSLSRPQKATHELKKLRQMSPMSAEATVVRNYLDWLLSIPWNKKSRVKKDLKAAQDVLDFDHFGLEKVKECIVEYLAVQQQADKRPGRSCAWSVRRASARPRWASRSRGRRAVSSCAFAWRHPRRGGAARPSPHLHRLDAGRGDSVAAPGQS